MIDRGGLVRWRLFGQPCGRRKKGTRYGEKRTLLFVLFCSFVFFFFLVPRRSYSSGVFCFLDETIGPKQERK